MTSAQPFLPPSAAGDVAALGGDTTGPQWPFDEDLACVLRGRLAGPSRA
jgi:hypothetical protein